MSVRGIIIIRIIRIRKVWVLIKTTPTRIGTKIMIRIRISTDQKDQDLDQDENQDPVEKT